jgi:hypothetical protein
LSLHCSCCCRSSPLRWRAATVSSSNSFC